MRPGVGKTWLSCALAQQAARSGFTVLYTRAPRLLEELRVAHGDGSFGRRLAQLARIDCWRIDDLAVAPVTAAERNDLLELLDDRVGTRATLITSQLPVKAWHEWLERSDRWPTRSWTASCTAAHKHRPEGRVDAQAKVRPTRRP